MSWPHADAAFVQCLWRDIWLRRRAIRGRSYYIHYIAGLFSTVGRHKIYRATSARQARTVPLHTNRFPLDGFTPTQSVMGPPSVSAQAPCQYDVHPYPRLQSYSPVEKSCRPHAAYGPDMTR